MRQNPAEAFCNHERYTVSYTFERCYELSFNGEMIVSINYDGEDEKFSEATCDACGKVLSIRFPILPFFAAKPTNLQKAITAAEMTVRDWMIAEVPNVSDRSDSVERFSPAVPDEAEVFESLESSAAHIGPETSDTLDVSSDNELPDGELR